MHEIGFEEKYEMLEAQLLLLRVDSELKGCQIQQAKKVTLYL